MNEPTLEDVLEYCTTMAGHVLARYRNLTSEDRADIIQDVCERIIRNWWRYDSTKSKWTTYAASITRNLIKDRIRQWWARNGPLEELPDIDTPALAAQQEIDESIIDDYIADKFASNVLHLMMQGCSEAEIAERIGSRVADTKDYLAALRELMEVAIKEGNAIEPGVLQPPRPFRRRKPISRRRSHITLHERSEP